MTPARRARDSWRAASTLSSAGLVRVRSGWAAYLTVSGDLLSSAGTHFVARQGATAVVALELLEARVVVAPPAVAAQLCRVDEDLLFDVHALVSRLEQFEPRPMGTASLSFSDARPVGRSSARVEPADDSMLETLRRCCPVDEWDESGLLAMPHRWAAFTPSADLAALAGYERWGTDIAHLGAAACPAERGRGYAAAAARAAMTAALHDGLVAQWRCRVGNEASELLAARLGFARLGRQTTIELTASDD